SIFLHDALPIYGWHFGFYFSLCLFFMGFHYILVYIKNDCWYWRSDAAFRFANMDYDYRFRKDSRQKCCIIWSFIWSWICSGAYYDEVSKYLRDIAVYRFSDFELAYVVTDFPSAK